MKHWLVKLKCDIGETYFFSHLVIKGRKPSPDRLARRFFDEAGGSRSGDGWYFQLGLSTGVTVTGMSCQEITEAEVETMMKFRII